MKKPLSIILFFLVLFFSCKKSDSDPQPGGIYRLAALVSEESSIRYHYNATGNCTSITATQAYNGSTIELKSFQYNEKNLLSSYTNLEHNETQYYEYTYTHDNLLASCKQYYDFPSLYLYATYKYHYDTYHNLNYVVRSLYTGQIDSIVYSKYVNGRPLQAVAYSTDNNTTTSYMKSMYTYDNRMNRIKVEASLVNDSTTFYTQYEEHYFRIDHPLQWKNIARLNTIQLGVILDDMNLNSKNKNTDFNLGVNFYESCGIVNLDSSEVLSYNTLGLPVHIKENATLYDCSHNINGKNVGDYKMVYENY